MDLTGKEGDMPGMVANSRMSLNTLIPAMGGSTQGG